MTHPLPTSNVIDVLDTLLDDMLAEEAETEKGDIRVAYIQRAIEILHNFEKLEYTENCEPE